MRGARKCLLAGTLLMIVFLAMDGPTGYVSAQSATGSFNPQTQLQVGSRIVIRSIYGIGTVRPHYTNATGQLPYHWNGTMQNLPTCNASITLDAQITADVADGGVQFAVQGGVIAVCGSTIAITTGQGEVSGVDRVMIQETAVDESGQSFNGRMEGIAALFNGSLISELSGNVPVTLNGVQTNLIITYLVTLN